MSLNGVKFINLGVVFFSLIAFISTFNADFINYDDPEYVINNIYIKKFSWENIQAIFAGKATILYVPLTIFSYLLEYSIVGPNPKVFHVTNLLLHITNALLLYRILGRLKINNLYLTGFILAFFTLNPLVTESVCWITERKDVLYSFFMFLSVLQFLKYEASKQLKHLIFCWLLFILSCFSKPMAVSLPVLMLIFIVYKSQKVEIKKLLFLLPFFLVSLIFSMVSITVISHGARGKTALTSYDVGQKVVLLLSEVGYYFFKPFVPVRQQLVNQFPAKADFYNTSSLILFAIAGMCLLCLIAYLAFVKKQKLIPTLFLCWLVFLIPVLQIYPNTHSYVSERYFYVSIVFPVVILFLLLSRINVSQQTFKWAFYLILPLFAVLTFNRTKVWINSKTLFEQELKMDDRDALALNNLGYYYNTQGEFPKGYSLLQKAVQMDDNNAYYLNNYGWALAGIGRPDSAMAYFNKAISKKPKFVDAMSNLGVCYMQKNETTKAFEYFSKAYALEPNNHEVVYNLGAYYLKAGQLEKARPLIRRAYELGNKSAAKYLKY